MTFPPRRPRPPTLAPPRADPVAKVAAGQAPERNCGTCRWFQPGDPTPAKPYANRGLCVFLLDREPGFHDRSTQSPWWALKLVHVVTDWEGRGCPTWTKKPKGQS